MSHKRMSLNFEFLRHDMSGKWIAKTHCEDVILKKYQRWWWYQIIIRTKCNAFFKFDTPSLFTFARGTNETLLLLRRWNNNKLQNVLCICKSLWQQKETSFFLRNNDRSLKAMVWFFTNAHTWQYWHYCQLCIPIYLRILSLFVTYDVSKCEIRYQWI